MKIAQSHDALFKAAMSDLTILTSKVMSLAQHIEQKGYKAGFEHAQVEFKSLKQHIEQQGFKTGFEKGQHALLIELLKFKFGKINQNYIRFINQADETRLV